MTASRDAHYAMLNDRFEGRAKRLRELGFKYEVIPGYDMAAFTRHRKHHPGKPPTTIPAAFVMNADEIVWGDRMEEVSRA